MNEQPGPSGDERGVTGSGPVSRQRWRTIVAVLLIVIGCVLAPLAGVAVWTRNQVTNTDRYVRTVAPLASDPAIQQAVADQITAQIFTYLDVQGLTNQAVDALAAQGLRPQVADRLRGFAGPLSSGIQSFVRTEVDKIVQSQAFADAWVQANRVAHQALVRALTGQGDGAVTVANDTVSVNLAPFIQTGKQRLVDSGFDLAARIPEVNASFVLFDVKNLTRAQAAFDLLNTLGIWLPIIAIVLLGAGVAVGMLVLALSLAVFRTIYLDAVPAAVLPHAAAAAAYDTIVAYLRLGLRSVLVLGLAVAAGAVADRPLAKRRADPPALGRSDRPAARRRGEGRVADRPGGDLGGCQQAAPAHRRRHPGRAGSGVLGPAHRQGDPPAGRAAAGRPRPDRVPRPATPTRRRPHHPDLNPAPVLNAQSASTR